MGFTVYLTGKAAFHCNINTIEWNDFRFPTGSLLTLQTHKDFYGHGHGSLVSKAISKRIAELGDDAVACVSESNSTSRRLFEKIGFVWNEKVHSLCTKIHRSGADDA